MAARRRKIRAPTVETPVRDAIRKAGGETAVARLLGISTGTLGRWARAGEVPDTKAAVKLSRASGVPVEQLAGDLDD